MIGDAGQPGYWLAPRAIMQHHRLSVPMPPTPTKGAMVTSAWVGFMAQMPIMMLLYLVISIGCWATLMCS
jgi:hypothetical protein